MTFESLGLAPALLRALAESNYTTPTPIQADAIPLVLAGHDVVEPVAVEPDELRWFEVERRRIDEWRYELDERRRDYCRHGRHARCSRRDRRQGSGDRR